MPSVTGSFSSYLTIKKCTDDGIIHTAYDAQCAVVRTGSHQTSFDRLKYKVELNIAKISVFKTKLHFITRTEWVMLFRELICIYCDNHKTYIIF